MFRTDEGIVRFVLEDNWNEIKNSTVNRLTETFHKHPDWFFTEHDIHSVLCNIAKEELQYVDILSVMTLNSFKTILMHHEFPTPFRCDMKKLGFQIKVDKPYKRGRYDLVVINPEFIRSNELHVVCGKEHQESTSTMRKVKVEPLIWACEVIFFLRVRKLPKTLSR